MLILDLAQPPWLGQAGMKRRPYEFESNVDPRLQQVIDSQPYPLLFVSIVSLAVDGAFFEIADGLTAEQIHFGQRRTEAVLDGDHADREGNRVHPDVVDEPGIPSDPTDVDVQIFAQNGEKLGVHRSRF